MRSRSTSGCLLLLAVCLTVSISFSQGSVIPEIPGWKITQEDPVYDANNLWDIIDGAADLYLEYAFVDLHIVRYISPDSVEVKTELYRHATDVDAFGMYSQERDTGYHFIPMGVQGYLQQGVLNFLTGSYYIKLSTYQTGRSAQEAMLTVGRRLVSHLQQNNTMPGIYLKFPAEGRMKNTEQYVARNFLGYSFLNSAYVVTYGSTAPFKVFVIESAVPEKADAMLAEYLKTVPKESVTKYDSSRYQIRDPHHGAMGLQICSQYLCGVIQCTDNEIQKNILSGLTGMLLQK
ncbi:MAG: hypothetical protein EHM64_09190 [Ignavibacteriae bacterium]|nr:MAG: hypothetical protein EHM64_09190 [Ignavibacteriota bacterium]